MNELQANLKSLPSAGGAAQGNIELPRLCRAMLDSLDVYFNVSFSLLDTSTGNYLHHGAIAYSGDDQAQSEICREVVRRGRPELVAEEDPVGVLCIPVLDETGSRFVALAPLLLRAADPKTAIQSITALGFDPSQADQWAAAQTPWTANRAVHLAQLVCAQGASDFRYAQMQREIDDLSSHLANAYEELSLLYGLTQTLKISASIEDIGQKALEWLAETVSAEGLVLALLPQQRHDSENVGHTHRDSLFLRFGRPVVDRYEFARLIEHFGLSRSTQPLVVNLRKDQTGDWPVPQVRQAVIVPLTEGDNLFGWLAAINHDERSDFGSSEASLLSSVAAILGIHTGNIELYRKQADFLAGVVRALTSATDAKDPYTCGHSDRVARVAVALAEQLGLSAKAQETIYLSGLLHDIGKIGIDDQVLRKPGKLTAAEYEHIKMHAEIGYRILKDLKQFDQVLPVVRHHHEAWDGSGYPFGLAGESIPLFARIVAVADSFDAMSSDRPYRKGMDDEQLDVIMKAGAGKQWDADVVEAYFAIRDQLRHIAHDEHETPSEELASIT